MHKNKEGKLMKEVWNSIQYAFAAIGGWLGWFMGGFDGFLYALVVVVTIDYITGVMCAILDRKISSDIGGKGIFRKVVIFSLVALGNIIDINILGKVGVIRTAVIFFYISNEGISILENATRLGLPIPEKLRGVLQQLNEGGDKDGN